jgi:hypothetical protein
MDPVLELFEGEHVHLEFESTSAEDAFFLTAQGMDFQDPDWSYQLIGPDGEVVYTDGTLPAHSHGAGHTAARRPHATARRGSARLSLFVSRDSADDAAWVGTWMLLVAWRTRSLDAMVMVDPGELMVPVAAGPVRGSRYARLLQKPERRLPARSVVSRPVHRLDIRPTATNRSHRPASTVVVNVHARTRLRVELRPELEVAAPGAPLTVNILTNALRGSAIGSAGFSRLMAPLQDLRALVRKPDLPASILRKLRLPDSKLGLDAALVLASLETRSAAVGKIRDEELKVVIHHEGPLHVHVENTRVPGPYHVGVWLEGMYHPGVKPQEHGHLHGDDESSGAEKFMRLLAVSVGLPGARRAPARLANTVSRRAGRGRRRGPSA